jgi:carbon-monoxide dehydrogenase medium subunit
MKPAPFEYHAPSTVQDVVQLLADHGDGAKILAGGQSLIPILNLRLAKFEYLVDIGRVAELRGIERRDGHLVIGAATRDSVIEFDPTVAADVPLLAAVTPYIGHFQIRNRGTIGGSLAHADPAAEYPAVAVALDATLEVASPAGARSVPAAEFFTGVWSTALEEGELLRSIAFPVWTGRCGFGVAEFARRHGDFAIAGAVAAVALGTGDVVERCAMALFGVAGTPVRSTAIEAQIVGRASSEIDPDEVARSTVDAVDDVTDDPQVPSAYRRRIAAAMVADAWRRAVAHAQNRSTA